MASRSLLGSVSTENFVYVSCQLEKQPTLRFNISESISTDIINLIHYDIWGLPMSLVLVDLDILLSLLMITLAIDGFFYIKHRSELLQVYCNVAKMVETQFSKHIKIFRSDNAFEYTQYAFQAILHSYGIVH